MQAIERANLEELLSQYWEIAFEESSGVTPTGNKASRVLHEILAHIDKLEAENNNLRTVMMAAAVEIQKHWDAHCDADGYGPANLMRRLEGGYPKQYGYNAETVVRLEAENERLTECLKKSNSQSEHFEREWYLRGDEVERLRKDAERYQWLTRTSDTNQLMVCDTDTQRLYFGYESDAAIDAARKGTP